MLIIIFQTSAKTSLDILMLQSIFLTELEQEGLLSAWPSKSGSAAENEQEPLKLEVWMSLSCLPNTWIPVLHSLYPQVARRAKGKLGAQKESSTRFNHSYRVFFQAELPKLCGFGWDRNTKLPSNILVFPFPSTG